MVKPYKFAAVGSLLTETLKLVVGDKSLFTECGKVNKVRISGKGRVRFIRGVALVHKSERESLPYRKAAVGEKIDKAEGFLSEASAGIFSGERRYVHEYTACSFHKNQTFRCAVRRSCVYCTTYRAFCQALSTAQNGYFVGEKPVSFLNTAEK